MKVWHGESSASQRVWKFMSILWAVIAMVKIPISNWEMNERHMGLQPIVHRLQPYLYQWFANM